MRRLFLIVAILILLCSGTLQGHTGSRPLGLGEAYTGLAPDIHALVYNPAGLSALAQWEFTYSRILRGETMDLSNSFLALGSPWALRSWSGGWGISYYDKGTERLCHLAWGLELFSGFNFGMKTGARYHTWQNTEHHSSRALSLNTDVGLLIRTLHPLHLGLVIHDALPPLTFVQGQIISPEQNPNLRMGLAYIPFSTTALTLDIRDILQKEEQPGPYIHLGMEHWFHPQFGLRGGYQEQHYSLGFSLRGPNNQYDLTYSTGQGSSAFILAVTRRF